MAEPKKIPSGMSMMLKALGIDIDPEMIKNVAGAVTGIHETLQRIEKRQIEIDRKLDEVLNGRGTGTSSSSDNSSGDGSCSSLLSSGEHSSKN
jgi:hypothetical protein